MIDPPAWRVNRRLRGARPNREQRHPRLSVPANKRTYRKSLAKPAFCDHNIQLQLGDHPTSARQLVRRGGPNPPLIAD